MDYNNVITLARVHAPKQHTKNRTERKTRYPYIRRLKTFAYVFLAVARAKLFDAFKTNCHFPESYWPPN